MLEKVKRIDLSVESLVIEKCYKHLFAPEELAIDSKRLAQVSASSFPDDAAGYEEGTNHCVLVNHYERDPKAREKCIELHGKHCVICNFRCPDLGPIF